jgi:hypothetical protein
MGMTEREELVSLAIYRTLAGAAVFALTLVICWFMVGL